MFETQIARGVALLDEKAPGWREGITQVDMVQSSQCVLGQVTGRYFSCEAATFAGYQGKVPLTGWDSAVTPYNAYMAQFGFAISLDAEASGKELVDAWNALTREWNTELSKERG